MKHMAEKGKIVVKKWDFRGKKVGYWGLKNTSWQPN